MKNIEYNKLENYLEITEKSNKIILNSQDIKLILTSKVFKPFIQSIGNMQCEACYCGSVNIK